MRLVTRFFAEEDAATAVEYAVMLALLLLSAFAAIGAVGTETSGLWNTIESDLTTAGVGAGS